MEEVFEGSGAFIVKLLEQWAAAGKDEFVVALFVSSKDGISCSVFDGHYVDEVAVVVVEDKEIVVATAGGKGETAGQVTIASPSGAAVKDCRIDMVGANAFGQGLGKRVLNLEERKLLRGSLG
jgi:hypothetical protein